MTAVVQQVTVPSYSICEIPVTSKCACSSPYTTVSISSQKFDPETTDIKHTTIQSATSENGKYVTVFFKVIVTHQKTIYIY